jgi:hypothetical protein
MFQEVKVCVLFVYLISVIPKIYSERVYLSLARSIAKLLETLFSSERSVENLGSGDQISKDDCRTGRMLPWV